MTRAAASEPIEIPEASEASPEWHAAMMLRLIEDVRFNPEKLAHYLRDDPGRIGFLDHMIEMLGGRSQ